MLTGAPAISTTAATNSPVGGYTITVSQGTLSAPNYSFVFDNGTLTVTQAVLTITSGISANDKIYDGTTEATISSNNVVLNGVAGVDASNVKLSTNNYSASFAGPNVGTNIVVTVGGLTLTGAGATNYTLSQPAGLSANIASAGVTITSGISANDKIYDGTTEATISSNNVVLNGVAGVDASNVKLSTNNYSASFAGPNVGTNIVVTVGGLTLTGAGATNYTLSQPVGLSANIASAGVTITSGISANNKTYDGTTEATISSNNVVLNGVAGVDASNVKLSTNNYSASFAGPNVGTNIVVTVGGLTLTGAGATNYTLSQPAGLSANIASAGVTITSGISANDKIYDGTATATISSNNVVLNGVAGVDASNVKLSTNNYSASFAGPNVGTNIVVTVGGLTLTGAGATNYTLSQPAGLSANIASAGVTITSGISANDKIYDGTATATISSNNVVLNGVAGVDASNVKLSTNNYSASFAGPNVGTNIVVTVGGLTLTGAGATNYTLSQPAGLSANIASAGVTITSGISANDKIYDGTTEATISSNNVVLNGVAGVDASNVKLSTNNYSANFASAGVANGIGVTVGGLTLTGAGATNYTLSQPAGLSANIASAGVTITSGISANDKIYDGTTEATISSNNVVLNGVAGVDASNVKLSTNNYSANFASAGVANGIGVTVGGLTLTGAGATNYTLSQPVGLSANIASAGVTITSGISANNKTYDGTTEATISSNNVVLNGVAGVDASNVKLSTNNYSASFAGPNVGTNIVVTVGGLTLTGAGATNYTLSQPAGLSANIASAGVTITSGISANDKIYDGTATATISSNNVVLNGVAGVDASNVKLSTNNYSASFAGPNVGTNIVVTVGGLTLTGAGATNYTLSQPAGLSANIASAGVTITSGISANDKIYDGTTEATISSNNVVLNGVAGVDASNVKLSTNNYSANFASAGVANGIGVTVGGLTLTGAGATNYTLSQPAGLSANIASAGVTITSGISANDKIYDGTTEATISSNNVVLNGVAGVDASNVKLSTNNYSASFAGPNVGTNIVVTVGGLTLTGAGATNYTLSQPAGLSANIASAGVTITSGISANDKIYDGTTEATISSNNVVLNGVAGVDASNVKLSTNDYSASFASPNVGTNIVVTVGGLTLTGAGATNYTLSQPAGLSANIASAGVTITSGISANDKIYDGTTEATISSNNVVLNGVAGVDASNVKLSTNNYSASFAGPNVGTNIGVTVGGLTLTGAGATNYTLSQPAGLTANITAKALSMISVPSPAITLLHLTNGIVTIAWNSVAGGIYRVQYINSLNDTNWTDLLPDVTATGSMATQTNVVTGVPQRFYRVNVLNSGITASNKVYDGTVVATINSNNVVLLGVVGGDTVNLSTNGYSASFASPNVGTDIVVTVSGLTLTGASAINYTLTPLAGVMANITPATLTVSALNKSRILRVDKFAGCQLQRFCPQRRDKRIEWRSQFNHQGHDQQPAGNLSDRNRPRHVKRRQLRLCLQQRNTDRGGVAPVDQFCIKRK